MNFKEEILSFGLFNGDSSFNGRTKYGSSFTRFMTLLLSHRTMNFEKFEKLSILH